MIPRKASNFVVRDPSVQFFLVSAGEKVLFSSCVSVVCASCRNSSGIPACLAVFYIGCCQDGLFYSLVYTYDCMRLPIHTTLQPIRVRKPSFLFMKACSSGIRLREFIGATHHLVHISTPEFDSLPVLSFAVVQVASR
jgi:hypothetical protein